MAHSNEQQKLTPFLWFEDQAMEAVEFYTSVFRNSRILKQTYYTSEGFEFHGKPEGTLMTVDFELEGQKFAALNGTAEFKFTPAISFFVVLENEQEVNQVWQKLSEGGSIFWDLDKYDWSEKYGWVQDRFGLSWQISLGKVEDVGQKITPSLLFTAELAGQAEEAINTYVSIFDNSSIDGILKFGPNEPAPEGLVKHAQFSLNGFKFMIMESAQDQSYKFNEAISFVVHCKSQEEVDHYWNNLKVGGDPHAQVCGWLKDRFGVSWQVVPDILTELLSDSDPEKVKKVTSVMLTMKKLDVSPLLRAYEETVDAGR